MPPKKATTSSSKTSKSANNTKTVPAKRKSTSSSNATSQPKKYSRRDARPAPAATLSYLLSDACAPLTRPEQETEALEKDPNLHTYTATTLTPFECLVSASLLSRPISHTLGFRAIRTLFNKPYSMHTPGAMRSAGREKLHEALFAARTLHKAKSAEQLFDLAEYCVEHFAEKPEDAGLGKLKRVLDKEGLDGVSEALRKVKGIGAVGVSVFVRRVQAVWDGVGPFLDDRTFLALKELDLPCYEEDLTKLINEEWTGLKSASVAKGKKDAEAKRLVFVMVLERALGAHLEKNVEEVMQQAAKGNA